MVDLHVKYAPLITEAMKKSAIDGTPVNGPIWWLDPFDEIALTIGDGKHSICSVFEFYT